MNGYFSYFYSFILPFLSKQWGLKALFMMLQQNKNTSNIKILTAKQFDAWCLLIYCINTV